jgi:hypothetical protein
VVQADPQQHHRDFDDLDGDVGEVQPEHRPDERGVGVLVPVHDQRRELVPAQHERDAAEHEEQRQAP